MNASPRRPRCKSVVHALAYDIVVGNVKKRIGKSINLDAKRPALESSRPSSSGKENATLSLKWVDRIKRYISTSVFWAYDCGLPTDKSGAVYSRHFLSPGVLATHIFVVRAAFDEVSTSSGRKTLVPRVESAGLVSVADLQARSSRPENVGSVNIKPYEEGWIRLWVVDDGVPSRFDYVYSEYGRNSLADACAELWLTTECDWYQLLVDSVESDSAQPLGSYIYPVGSSLALVEEQKAATEAWKLRNGESFGEAAFSAFDIPRNPRRIATHCLVVRIGTKRKANGQYSHVVHSGEALPLPEVRHLFRPDLLPSQEQYLREALFIESKLLRTVMIDDSLPQPLQIYQVHVQTSAIRDLLTMYLVKSDWLAFLKSEVDNN